MESSKYSTNFLVKYIKEEIFCKLDVDSFVSPSAYDTAWLAMIPQPKNADAPMFKSCLNWILNNQREEGFWGEPNSDGLPTIAALSSTLACMVALKKWNVGHEYIEKGLEFMHANTEMLLKVDYQRLPRWFVIVFPAMVDLAKAISLDLVFPDELKTVISTIYSTRQQMLQRKQIVDKNYYPPLLSYLETLPSTYDVDQQLIIKHLSDDDSLFQSPSATARAFMATGNQKCMDYLESLIQRFPDGVPAMYPMDEGMIKLFVVDQVQRLGLAEHFSVEIEEILAEMHKSYKNQEPQPAHMRFNPTQINKDFLAFRLLRMHGYNVTPCNFCWFLHNQDIMLNIEQNSEHFVCELYNIYRATDLMFPGEDELEQARSISRKFLEKALMSINGDNNPAISPSFRKLIEHELSIPWIARLDHLDQRMWIEEYKGMPVWIGKAGYQRLSCLHNEKLMQLAVQNYEFRQSIYMNELELLKRWSKQWGLNEMGFGREKTTYSYFAVSASSPQLPGYSDVRMIVAKSAIIITVADDFYDMKVGSLSQLQTLTEAVQKWDGKGLSGPSRIIFMALDDMVNEIVIKYFHQHGSDITENLRDIWRETFVSWMTETRWSINGYVPSIDEYLETGMTSIAAHTMVLTSSCLLGSMLPREKLMSVQYETITKLLMTMSRMLNDIESYQKEEKEGKTNLVSLMVKANPHAGIENSVVGIKQILLEELRKDFLKHTLMDDLGDLPKSCKHLHLSCLKTFQMFFNSANRFDSNTELLEDINKAIYVPLESQTPKRARPPPLVHTKSRQGDSSKISSGFHQSFTRRGPRNFIGKQFHNTISGDRFGKLFVPSKLNICFI